MEINEIQKEIQNIRLTTGEKSAMLERIYSSPLISPYTPIKSLWRFQHTTLIYVLGCLMLFVLGGTGISIASLNSIPGQNLYSIKTKIAEPFRDTFAFTPESHAKLEANKAIRRLDEAQTLISKDNLTQAHRVEIENRFKENAKNFDKAVSGIKDNSEKGKRDLENSFEKSLNSRADNFKNVKDNLKNENEKQKQEVDSLENTIRERVNSHSNNLNVD